MMDERAASSPATPDDRLLGKCYVPQLLGGHLTYSARHAEGATNTPIERVFRF